MTFELIEKTERRYLDDELAFADRATWLESHGIKTDRRKPRNIINENNHEDNCLLIIVSGCCTCGENNE